MNRKVKKSIINIYGYKNLKIITKELLIYKISVFELLSIIINLVLIYKQYTEIHIIIFDLILIVLINHTINKEIIGIAEKRIMKIEKNIPNIIDEIIIYFESGYVIENALKYSIKDNIFFNEIIENKKINQTYLQSFGHFIQRYDIQNLKKIYTILKESKKNGNKNIIINLKNISFEAWDDLNKKLEKNASRVEAKLFIPIFILFIGVLFILISPAFLNMMSII